MPFSLVRSGDGWKVQDDKGKVYSDEPLSRKRAASQMRALYANAPDAEQKDVSGEMGINASGPGSPNALGLAGKKPSTKSFAATHNIARWHGDQWTEIKEDSMDSTAEKHGSHDQKTHGQRWGMQGLRDYAKKSGLTVRTMQDGKIGIFGKKGDRTNMRATGITSAKKLIRSHNKLKRENERDLARARRDSEERVRVIDRARVGNQPAGAKPPSKTPGNLQALKPGTKKAPARESIGGKKVSGSGVFKKGGESYAYYTTTGRDGRRSYTFDGGKTWQRSQLDAFISAAGGYENAYPILSQRKEALEILLSDTDYSGEASLECSGHLSVFKDSDGQYRWILQSSNAFRDRDNEIVSRKALEADVEATDESGSYGPLRWWHCKGYDLGDCDFRLVHGRTLIESGTFRSNEIGERIKEHAGRLQVSIGFNHPPDEPDADGVFHTIRTFERSLLPAGKAANPFTRVVVKGDEPMATKEEKLKALRTLGIDPNSVLQQAEETEKELDAKGVAFKENEDAPEAETDPVTETDKEAPETETAPAADADGEAEKAKKPAPKKTEEEPEEDEPEDDEEEEVPVIGNMGVKEFGEMLTKALSEAMAPVMKAVHTHDPEEGKKEREKEAGERAALKEQIDAQQSSIDSLRTQIAASEQSLKASQDALAAANAAIVAAGQTMKELNGRLAELEGSRPRALSEKGYDATADDETVIDDERAKELGAPVADPAASTFMDFTQNFLLGGNQ